MPEKPDKTLPLEFTEIILDSVSDGVFTVDENMKVTYFNRAAEKITGVSKDEAIGRSCYNVFRSNICEKNCIYNCAFESGTEIIDKHVNILRTDGKVIPVSVSTAVLKDVNGKTIGGVETFRDLSSFEEL